MYVCGSWGWKRSGRTHALTWTESSAAYFIPDQLGRALWNLRASIWALPFNSECSNYTLEALEEGFLVVPVSKRCSWATPSPGLRELRSCVTPVTCYHPCILSPALASWVPDVAHVTCLEQSTLPKWFQDSGFLQHPACENSSMFLIRSKKIEMFTPAIKKLHS